MKEPKYKIGDWVKLHAITAKGSTMTYHVINIYIDICESGSQVKYQLREHDREKGITGRLIGVAEMEIEAQVGTTAD